MTEFDIPKHDNEILPYNLTYYHSINNDKEIILKALSSQYNTEKIADQYVQDTNFIRSN